MSELHIIEKSATTFSITPKNRSDMELFWAAFFITLGIALAGCICGAILAIAGVIK